MTLPYKQPAILVFDSGLGGLSVIGELKRANLNAVVSHIADTDWFPYGERADDTLIARVPQVITQALTMWPADLVIIACNTASTIALDSVRQSVTCPVVGVVPAIKPAAQMTQTGTIGLLATPGTVRRPYTDQLIQDHAAGRQVLRHGAVGLAAQGEAKLAGRPVDLGVVQACVDGLFQQAGGDAMDVIVLACTHYPLLAEELQACAPRPVGWIDSGAAIARRVGALLHQDLTQTGAAWRLTLDAGMTTGGDDAGTRLGLKQWGFQRLLRLDATTSKSEA